MIGVLAMEARRCPRCDATTVIPGYVANGEGMANGFVPVGTQAGGIILRGVKQTFLACWTCGHVAISVAPEELRAHIESHGNELIKQHVERIKAGPYFDLPDCSEARKAADGVIQIDFLIMEGRHREATRLFRELTGKTWDQAIDGIRGWRDLKRAEKLARFGWVLKNASKPDQSEVPSHPMHDRLLDG
jgi:hypothetical protein